MDLAISTYVSLAVDHYRDEIICRSVDNVFDEITDKIDNLAEEVTKKCTDKLQEYFGFK
jgi:Zn-dependent M32 family carboxypeptidase